MNDPDVIEVDATGLRCPMPLLKAKRALNAMAQGQQLLLLSTDSGSHRDMRLFAEQSGHKLLATEEINGVFRFLLQKA